MATPPNQPPNPRLRVTNPGEEKPRNKMWETIKIAAITTLAGAAAVGIGASVYKYAVKRTRRLLRREDQRREENSTTMHPSYQQAVGYPMYVPMPGYQPWPTASSERDRMPEALREIPNFHGTPQPMAQQPMAQPMAQPPSFVAAPPPSTDPNMRRFMDDMRKRLSNIESYLQEDGDDEDDEDDEDDNRGRGKN